MNISPSNYNLYEPVSLTNEIPHLSIYAILNRQLQNEWVRDIIGQTSVDYEAYDDIKLMKANLEDIEKIPYDEEKEPIKYQEALNKIIRYRSPNYNPDHKVFVKPDNERGEIVEGDIHKVNFSVDGLFETEIDYLMHEMHRYLFRMYPEHYNTLTTLTPAERLTYFQEAGYMINSSFDLTNLPGETEEEAFYMQHKFITNLATAMKYTGTLKQEVILLNLLGKADIVKNVDYYVTDSETGVISNSYNGSGKVELRKAYQYRNDDSFLSSYADTLFANTEDTFRFATKKVKTEESQGAALPSILTWYKSDNTFEKLLTTFNNLFKHGDAFAPEGTALAPVATDLTVEDLISKYKDINLRATEDPVHFILSYDNKRAVVPFREASTKDATVASFDLDFLKEVQGKKFSNILLLGDLPTAYEFYLGKIQYNESFLNWISMFIYERLIASFEDNDFALKYTGCIRQEIQYDWNLVVEVRQSGSARGSQDPLLLRGILNKDFINRAYSTKTLDIEIGDGETYNPNGVTPEAVFKYLDNPKNVETYKLGDGNLTVALTLSRFLKGKSPDLDSGDETLCCPHTGIPYVKESSAGIPADEGSDPDLWPSIDALTNDAGYQFCNLEVFSLQMNTIEIPYKDLFRLKALFDLTTETKLVSYVDDINKRIFFYNQVRRVDSSTEDPTPVNTLAFNEDNICDFIFKEVELGSARLRTVRGHLVDNNHLKLESDITELIKLYGRVDFFMVNCAGERYFGKLNKAEVQNDYCLATIDKVSPIIDSESWLEDTVNIYIFAKSSELLPDIESADLSMSNPQEVLKVKPAQVNSIPYFLCDTDGLETSHLRYLYNTIFSEAPEVYYDESMRAHKLYEPTSLVKYESILGVQGASIDDIKVCQDLIDEHKSLYIDSDLYANAIVPYVEKSVTYNGVAKSISTNYNPNNLPAYIYFTNVKVEDYPDFEELYEAAQAADEKDMGYIVKTYNNHLVIWGDVIWDTNEVDTVKRLRTIWSSFLSSFVVEDLKGRFPTMPEVKADADVNPIEIKINNFNYSYNDGLPTVAYNLTIPGFKNPKVTKVSSITSLSSSLPIEVPSASKDASLYAVTKSGEVEETFEPSFKIAIKKEGSSSYIEDSIGFSNCKLVFSDNYSYEEVDDRSLALLNDLRFTYEGKNIHAVNKFIESDAFLSTPTLFNSSERYYEFLAQQLIANYAYNVYSTNKVEGEVIKLTEMFDYYLSQSYIPAVVYIDNESPIVAIAFFEKDENNEYKISLERHRIPNIPKFLMNTLEMEANSTLIYEDDSVLKSLQKIITEPGDYIPIGSEGYFTRVDLTACEESASPDYNNIFSSSVVDNGNLEINYTDSKTITNDTVRYVNNKASFTLIDKIPATEKESDGAENEYSFTYNERMFKEYDSPSIRIHLDETTLDTKLKADLLMEFPYGTTLEEGENILLKDLTTPVTRATYAPNKEVMIVNRSYTLAGCNIISKDEDSLYLEDNEIRGLRVSEALKDLVPTNSVNATKGIDIAGSTIKLGKHWKPSETPIDYRYYKRKFIAKGKIFSSEPNTLIFDDLGTIKLKDHISSADNMQLITLNILGDTIEANHFNLPSITITIEDKSVNDFTWKLLGGEAELNGSDPSFILYLAALSDEGGFAGTLRLSANPTVPSSFTEADFPAGISTANIKDVFIDDENTFHFVADVATTVGGVTVTERKILPESASPVIFDTDEYEPASDYISDSKLLKLNLSGETTSGREIAQSVIGARSTKILTDFYGRISRKVDENRYIMLNDIGSEDYTNYTLEGAGASHDTSTDTANAIALIEALFGLTESGTLDLSITSDTDPSRKALINLLCRQDASGVATAHGKTPEAAFNSGCFLVPYLQTAVVNVYTDSEYYTAKRTVNVFERSSDVANNVLSSTNANAFYRMFASDYVMSNFGQKIFTAYTESDTELSFFDHSRCNLYILNKLTNSLETIPLMDYLGEKTDTPSGNLPLVSAKSIIKLGSTELNDVLSGYKNIISSCGADELDTLKRIFRSAYTADPQANADLYEDLSTLSFEKWIQNVNDLVYSNPSASFLEYSKGCWPLSNLTSELKKFNYFGIDFEGILEGHLTESQIKAVEPDAVLWDATSTAEVTSPQITYKSECDAAGLSYEAASFATEPEAPTTPANTELGEDGYAVVKNTINGYTYTKDDFKYEGTTLQTRLGEDMQTIQYDSNGNFAWRSLTPAEGSPKEAPAEFNIPAELEAEEPTADTVHYSIEKDTDGSTTVNTYPTGTKEVTYEKYKVSSSVKPVYYNGTTYSLEAAEGFSQVELNGMQKPEAVEAPEKSTYNKWLDLTENNNKIRVVAKKDKVFKNGQYYNTLHYVEEYDISTTVTKDENTCELSWDRLPSPEMIKDPFTTKMEEVANSVTTALDDMIAKAKGVTDTTVDEDVKKVTKDITRDGIKNKSVSTTELTARKSTLDSKSSNAESESSGLTQEEATELTNITELLNAIKKYRSVVDGIDDKIKKVDGSYTYADGSFKGLPYTITFVKDTTFKFTYTRVIAVPSGSFGLKNWDGKDLYATEPSTAEPQTSGGHLTLDVTNYMPCVEDSTGNLGVQINYKDLPSIRVVKMPIASDYVKNTSEYPVAKKEYNNYESSKGKYKTYIQTAEVYDVYSKWAIHAKAAENYNNQSLQYAKYSAWLEQYYAYADAVDTWAEEVKKEADNTESANNTYYKALYFYATLLQAEAEAEIYNQAYDSYRLSYENYRKQLGIKEKVDRAVKDHNSLIYFKALTHNADAVKDARDFVKSYDGNSVKGWNICTYVIANNEDFVDMVWGTSTPPMPIPGSLGTSDTLSGAFSTVLANQYFESKVKTINICLTPEYVYLTGRVECEKDKQMWEDWNSVGTVQPSDGSTSVVRNFCLTLNRATKKIYKPTVGDVKSVIQVKDKTYFADNFVNGNVSPATLTNGSITNTTGESTITSSIPLSVIFNSGMFEDVSVTSTAVQVVNSFTSIDYSQLLENKVGTIGKDFIKLITPITFSNCESTEVIVFIEDQTKDNFQFGFNELGMIAEALPDAATIFPVGSASCADFAQRVNNYNIDRDTNLYCPIFEDGTYPYPEDITEGAKLSDFYVTERVDGEEVPKVLKNSLGRNIIPIFPMDIELDAEATSGTVKALVLEEGTNGLVLKQNYAKASKPSATDYPLVKKDEGVWKYYNGSTYTELGTGNGVPSSVVMETSSLLYKPYKDVYSSCGTLYELVGSPKDALIAKPYEIVEVVAGTGSKLTLENSYIKLSNVSVSSIGGLQDRKDIYKNANVGKNTTGKASLEGYLTIEELVLNVPYRTASLPKMVPITKFNKNLATGRVFTYNTEIAFPLNGYGSSILDVSSSTEFFDPKDCKFALGTFFKKSSSGMLNTDGVAFKVYLGEGTDGEPIYNDKFFATGSSSEYGYSLNFGSFSLADKNLSKDLIPRDPAYAEMQFYTYNEADVSESLTVITADCIDSTKSNTLRISYPKLLEIFRETDEDFDKVVENVSLARKLYDLASYDRNWVCECYRSSTKLDETKPWTALDDLISQQTVFNIKSAAEVNNLIGHTRRFNGSLATTVPANLTYIKADGNVRSSLKRFEAEPTEVVQGRDAQDSNIYACDKEGKLLRIDSNGVISSGLLLGDLIYASESAEISTDIRKVVVSSNKLDLNNISGVLISIDKNNIQRVNSGIKFVADGKLSYIYSSNEDVLSSGELNVIWKTPKDSIKRDALKCKIGLGDKIEFTYTATSSESYNYAILLDKNRNTVGQIYLGGGIGPNTLLSYIRA